MSSFYDLLTIYEKIFFKNFSLTWVRSPWSLLPPTFLEARSLWFMRSRILYNQLEDHTNSFAVICSKNRYFWIFVWGWNGLIYRGVFDQCNLNQCDSQITLKQLCLFMCKDVVFFYFFTWFFFGPSAPLNDEGIIVLDL